MSKSIDLVRYAEAMAHLQYFSEDKRGEVIARLGLQPSAWEKAATKWAAAREAELSKGGLELSLQYSDVFAKTRRRLEAERPTLESLGPLPAENAEPSPSTNVAPPPLQADVPVPFALSPSTDSPSVWARHGMPSFAVLPSSFPAPPASSPPPPASSPPPPAVVRPPVLAMTAGPPVHVPEHRLPFVSAPPGVRSDYAASTPRSEVPNADRREPRESTLASTVCLDGSGAMPTPPPEAPNLTIEQYASLRVELAIYPDRHPMVLARYRITPALRNGLDDYWRARFEADPLLRMVFARSYASYVAWLKANPL